MIELWNALLYKPLYNGLVFLTSIAPFKDVGIAVVLLTIIVKLALFPLARKSIIHQARMKTIEGDVARIKKEFPDKQEQAKKTFELYQKNKVNPFASCLVILIQLPIIIALYQTFRHGLGQSPDLLYSFIHYPDSINMTFLGIIDLTKRSLPLALLAGITQFIQTQLSLSQATPPPQTDEPKTFQSQLAQSMQFQVKYLLPPFIVFIGYSVSAAVALYWVTSNIVSIVQEIIVRKMAGLPITKAIFSFKR